MEYLKESRRKKKQRRNLTRAPGFGAVSLAFWARYVPLIRGMGEKKGDGGAARKRDLSSRVGPSKTNSWNPLTKPPIVSSSRTRGVDSSHQVSEGEEENQLPMQKGNGLNAIESLHLRELADETKKKDRRVSAVRRTRPIIGTSKPTRKFFYRRF